MLQYALFGIFLLWSFSEMFVFSGDMLDLWRSLNLSLNMSNHGYDWLSETLLPWVVLYVWIMICADAVRSKSYATSLHSFVCLLVVGIGGIPLFSLTPRLKAKGFIGADVLFQPLWRSIALPHHLSNGYGLFRRMTGVGAVGRDMKGWAGLQPSVVARPEIILEAVFEQEASVEEWVELDFRWKPGRLNMMPKQVAPHQPRYALVLFVFSPPKDQRLVSTDWIGRCGSPLWGR